MKRKKAERKRSAEDVLARKYRGLDDKLELPARDPDEVVDPGVLLAFEYEHPDQPAEVVIDTEEFTALCPWTGLPDLGRLEIRYVPDRLCLELKSLKYYLLGYRSAAIVQEHAAARILKDLVAAVRPKTMTVVLDYRTRGGIHTRVKVEYPGGREKA
ncbi:MAG: NADPH-dependent 7-cyano-7-deazaguanine reductase QueF [Deltaproteobacteria bacterium]|nr:MAG: NADPH-dependent 7-cyano-7-deazaguanine reductase QueF [Deltaproteobacteria bacterium]